MKKPKHEFMDKYKCIIDWDDEDQIFVARYPELKGCASHGDSTEEAARNAHFALELYLDSLKERNIEAPRPIALVKASGKIPARTSPETHKALLDLSIETGESMNALVDVALNEFVRTARNRLPGKLKISTDTKSTKKVAVARTTRSRAKTASL